MSLLRTVSFRQGVPAGRRNGPVPGGRGAPWPALRR